MQTAWPVALDREVLPGSLVRARLLDFDIVIWRASDGVVRVWEDRCPHRSVRLSAGRILQDCVEDVYHGWRFNKDGKLVLIPAQKQDPIPSIQVRVLQSKVAGGFVWATFDDKAIPPALFNQTKALVTLRPLPFEATAEIVRVAVSTLDGVNLVVTPNDVSSCTVYGLAERRPTEIPLATVQRVNATLNALRRNMEAGITV